MSEWWETFFEGPWRDVYPTVFTADETRQHGDRVERLLELNGSARILDVPCGYGRMTVELASRGHSVAGLDLSGVMIETAGRLAQERDLELELVRGDMREIPWVAEFDAVACNFSSIGYALDDANDRDFFRSVFRALKPRGRFLIDTLIAETYLRRFSPRKWSRHGDLIQLEESRYDYASSRVESSWTFLRDGRMETWTSSIRVYAYRELASLLHAAGFEEISAFDWDTLEPFALGASNFALVTQKP